jgi:hypothetical protein
LVYLWRKAIPLASQRTLSPKKKDAIYELDMLFNNMLLMLHLLSNFKLQIGRCLFQQASRFLVSSSMTLQLGNDVAHNVMYVAY